MPSPAPAQAPPSYAPPPAAYPPPFSTPPGWNPPRYAPPPPTAPPAPYYPGSPGYAPPGYYPSYYPPPYLLGPKTMPYVEGQTIPPGYAVETRLRKGLFIAGLATFGGPYVISLVMGAAFLSEGEDEGDELWPLLIPVAGPFVSIGTSQPTGAGTLILILDGVAQAGGLVLTIAGAASEETLLVRNDARRKATPVAFRARPDVIVHPSSASLRWRF